MDLVKKIIECFELFKSMSMSYFINENNILDLLIETTLNNTFKLFLNDSVKK